MLSRLNSVCKGVCLHMVTTGLQASLPHQNSTHRKHDGGREVSSQMWSIWVARGWRRERERERNVVNVLFMCVRLTHTSGAISAGDVASRTGAHIATSSVGALSSIAHTRDGAALINIWSKHHKTFSSWHLFGKTAHHYFYRYYIILVLYSFLTAVSSSVLFLSFFCKALCNLVLESAKYILLC